MFVNLWGKRNYFILKVWYNTPMENEIEKGLDEMLIETIRQKFEEYRKSSDPYIAISDQQASWVLEFIKTIL